MNGKRKGESLGGGARPILGLAFRMVLGGLLGACSPSGEPAVPKNPETVVGSVEGSGIRGKVLFFPARWKPRVPRPPIVLVGPEILDTAVLYDHGDALIPYLTFHGYPVLVLDAKGGPFGPDAASKEIPKLLQAARKQTEQSQFILGGVSSGGRQVLRFMGALKAQPNLLEGITIPRIFFLGTGFDYNYPDSFPRRMAKAGLRGPSLGTACSSGNAKRFCEMTFRSASRPQGYIDLLRFLPKLEDEPGTSWSFVDHLTTPVLFMVGKVDNLSPVETIFPIYWRYGSKTPKGGDDVKKRYFVAGAENMFDVDYDELSFLMEPSSGSEGYRVLVQWLDDDG